MISPMLAKMLEIHKNCICTGMLFSCIAITYHTSTYNMLSGLFHRKIGCKSDNH